MSIETQAIAEEEAGKRWCPFARVAMAEHKGAQWNLTHYAPAFNRLAANGEANKLNISGSYCIASECMAWKWRDGGLDGPRRVHPNALKSAWTGWRVTNEQPDERGFVEISPPPPTHGYCGLAGRP